MTGGVLSCVAIVCLSICGGTFLGAVFAEWQDGPRG